jgi:hypothetical protein
VEIKPFDVDVTGPFRVLCPITGGAVRIWCDTLEIKDSQKKFMKIIKERNKNRKSEKIHYFTNTQQKRDLNK